MDSKNLAFRSLILLMTISGCFELESDFDYDKPKNLDTEWDLESGFDAFSSFFSGKASRYKKCIENRRFIKEAYLLIKGTRFKFSCNACLNKTEVASKMKNRIWKFIPSFRSDMLNIVVQKPLIKIDNSGNLHQARVEHNGTYYCIYNKRILSIYSVTVIERDLQYSKYLVGGEEPSQPKFKDFNKHQYMVKWLKSYQSPCTALNLVNQQVYICYVIHILGPDILNSFSDTLDTMLEKTLRFEKGIPCLDPLIQPHLHHFVNKSEPMIFIKKKVCPQRFWYRRQQIMDSYNWGGSVQSLNVLRNHAILGKATGQSALVSCWDFIETQQTQELHHVNWLKFRLNKSEQVDADSQWLSPMFLHRTTSNRMRFDFMGNIVISPIEDADLEYMFRCYDESQPLGTVSIRKAYDLKSKKDFVNSKVDGFSVFCLIVTIISIWCLVRKDKNLKSKIY